MAAKRADRAVYGIAIGLLVDTDPFVSILLIVQFECSAVGGGDEGGVGCPGQATKAAVCILFEECDVFKFELHCLFG